MKTNFSTLLLVAALLLGLPIRGYACNPAEISPYNAYDARVFNWQYYLNQNADLMVAGHVSEAQAKQHWYAHGICEGRIAHPNFHSEQYLSYYPDVNSAYGGRLSGGMRHYLEFGVGEGRYGYRPDLVDGYKGRWVARNFTNRPQSGNLLTVSASARVAGAIDSVFWKNMEFVNAWDHGREIQPAVFVNGQGMCNNPTMAGGDYDYQDYPTHSILEGIWSNGRTVAAQVLPAYWTAPEQYAGPELCNLAPNYSAVNGTYVSNYRMNTNTQVGYKYSNVIRFDTVVVIPENVSSLMIEASTGYLTGDMTEFYAYDLAARYTNSAIVPVPVVPDPLSGEQNKPLVVSNPGGTKAMAVWSPGLPQPGLPPPLLVYGYGVGRFFDTSRPANATMKWNIVYRYGATNKGTSFGYTTYMVVGTKADVVTRMAQLYAAWKAGTL